MWQNEVSFRSLSFANRVYNCTRRLMGTDEPSCLLWAWRKDSPEMTNQTCLSIGGKIKVRKYWCSVLNRVLFGDQLPLGSILASITYYLISDLSLSSLLWNGNNTCLLSTLCENHRSSHDHSTWHRAGVHLQGLLLSLYKKSQKEFTGKLGHKFVSPESGLIRPHSSAWGRRPECRYLSFLLSKQFHLFCAQRMALFRWQGKLVWVGGLWAEYLS